MKVLVHTHSSPSAHHTSPRPRVCSRLFALSAFSRDGACVPGTLLWLLTGRSLLHAHGPPRPPLARRRTGGGAWRRLRRQNPIRVRRTARVGGCDGRGARRRHARADRTDRMLWVRDSARGPWGGGRVSAPPTRARDASCEAEGVGGRGDRGTALHSRAAGFPCAEAPPRVACASIRNAGLDRNQPPCPLQAPLRMLRPVRGRLWGGGSRGVPAGTRAFAPPPAHMALGNPSRVVATRVAKHGQRPADDCDSNSGRVCLTDCTCAPQGSGQG